MLWEAVSSALGRGDSVEEERTAGVVIYPCRGGVDSAIPAIPAILVRPLILEEKGGSALKVTNWVVVGRWEADGGGGLKRGRPETHAERISNSIIRAIPWNPCRAVKPRAPQIHEVR